MLSIHAGDQGREYVTKDQRYFKPTEWDDHHRPFNSNFGGLVRHRFHGAQEDDLDEIAQNKKVWETW